MAVEGGGALRVTLANDGTLAHNLRLRRGGREVGGTPTFGAGESRSRSVELSEGRYSMVCTVGSHEELGMRGTLIVRWARGSTDPFTRPSRKDAQPSPREEDSR